MFGSYRVIDEIGAGRFGPVYRAADESPHVMEAAGRDVAIKVFDQGLSAEQAVTLAHALTRLCDAPLDHPSIVAPIGAGINGASAWLAEPYVEATPLDAILKRRGPLPLADMLLRLTQAAGALDFAWATGVCHGALHPRDILFAGDRTLVTGLGVAQALAEANIAVPGRVAMVSPADRSLMHCDDIRALALITFEALYGRPLSDPSRLASFVAPLPGVDHVRLRDTLQRALADDPAERPSTALEFAKALQGCIVTSDPTVEVGGPPATADSAVIAPIPRSLPVDDLPLRASEPEPAAEPDFEPAFVAEPRNRTSSEDVAVLNANPETEPHRSVWVSMAAMLVVGLLMGFAAGFILGQRDLIPAPRSAERAIPRAQREAAREPVPTPTVGQDFTESAVPSLVEEAEVQPPSDDPRPAPVSPVAAGTARPAREPAKFDRVEPRTVQASASMEVVSRPAGAQVFVNGRMVGRTPLVLPEVNPGDHAVRISLPGHQRWVTTVNVTAGARARVAASLER